MPTLADFAKEFGGQLLASEGALWRTLRGLFSPGHLTRVYLAGQRRRYLAPLRLFLSICILCATLVHWVRPDQQAPVEEVVFLDRSVGMRHGRFLCEGIPDHRCDYWQRRISADPELLQDLERTRRNYNQAAQQAVFLAMPASMALMLQLAYWRRRQPFGAHMVAALHLHCITLPLVTAQVILARWVPAAETPISVLIAAAVVGIWATTLRRVYGGRLRATFARFALLLMAYPLAFAMWTSLAVAWSLQRTVM